MGEPEEDLVGTISQTLENHGYLPRVRAGLKVIALKTAQDLVASNKIQGNAAISAKHFDNQDDALQIQLCRNFFQLLNLEKAAEMLAIEAESPEVNLEEVFPSVAKPNAPVLVSLIERAQSK